MLKLVTRTRVLLLATAVAGSVAVMKVNAENSTSEPAAQTGAAPANSPADNPLLAEWTGPHDGTPPFDRVQVALFKPALEAAMAENLAEIDKIAADKSAPTFENTIEALERTGGRLDRVTTVYGVWSSTMNSPEFQAIQREMAPETRCLQRQDHAERGALQTHRGCLQLARQEEVDAGAAAPLVALLHELRPLGRQARRDGEDAPLGDQPEARRPLHELQPASPRRRERPLPRPQERGRTGRPAAVLTRRRRAGRRREEAAGGTWVILNTRSSVDPFLTYSDRRDLREKVWRMFVNRGDNGDEHDNNAIITEILQLRAERAKLLGYPTHAHWRLENAMAKTPERAMELMEAVWKPAVARVREEVADMQALADKEGAKIKIEPWDYRYYMEKVRKARYDLDQNEVKPYLQLEKLREGIFWVAGELFNFKFEPAANIPVYHPDVRVWEVTDKTSGKHIGYWYFDPYAARRQAFGRVDERVPQPGADGRQGSDDHRLEQLELREG